MISDYEEQLAHNNALMQTKQTQMIEELMEQYGVEMQEIVDFMYHLNAIRKHGYGVISVHVTEGRVTKVEAMMRTLRYQEMEVKVK